MGGGVVCCCRSLGNTNVSGALDGLANLTKLTNLYPRCVDCACLCAAVRKHRSCCTRSELLLVFMVLVVISSKSTAALSSTSSTHSTMARTRNTLYSV